MRPEPFLFCRYSIHASDELLDASGTLQVLSEIQGQFLPSGVAAESRGERSLVVMKPERLEVGGETVIRWLIGHKPGHRTVTDYDAGTQEVKYSVERDRHILHTTIIAVPRIGALAVSDRVNALHMGGKPALNRMRAVFRKIEGGAFSHWFLQPGDITAIVNELDLKEYAYTIRRINPTPPGVLSAALDESMKAEGIGIQRGTAKPMPGETMQSNEGFIAATTELAEAGYGVLGFKGHTNAGRLAQIKKPPFSMDKKENIKEQAREHPLRVFIESEAEEAIWAGVVAELVRFYGRDGPSDILEEPA